MEASGDAEGSGLESQADSFLPEADEIIETDSSADQMKDSEENSVDSVDDDEDLSLGVFES